MRLHLTGVAVSERDTRQVVVGHRRGRPILHEDRGTHGVQRTLARHRLVTLPESQLRGCQERARNRQRDIRILTGHPMTVIQRPVGQGAAFAYQTRILPVTR